MPTQLTHQQETAIKKEAKKYLWLVMLPVIILILVFIGYASISFISASSDTEPMAIGRFIAGFVGILAFTMFILFSILGVIEYFSLKKNVRKMLEGGQYSGLTIEQIIYLAKASTTGFFATPVFTLGNGLYTWAIIPLIAWILSFVSYYYPDPALKIAYLAVGIGSLFVAFKMSSEGRRLAWKKSKDKSFEKFKKKQKIIGWIAGLLYLVAFGVGLTLGFTSSFTNMDQIADIKSEVTSGKMSLAEGAYKLANTQNPAVNNFGEFQKGYLLGETDGQNKDLKNVIINPELKPVIQNPSSNFSFLVGYITGFSINCRNNPERDASVDCKNLIKEKAEALK